eukprot:SM000182S03924  [mRNA]  locus=s182:48241:51327:- [translate_table: standard]
MGSSPSPRSHHYFTRARGSSGWRAAGVLPVARDDGNGGHGGCGSFLALLGREPSRGRRGAGWWRDFGGHREAGDDGPEATAAREFSEETLGLFAGAGLNRLTVEASTAAMAAHLRAGPEHAFRVAAPMKGRGHYCMYVAAVTYIDPLMFDLATEENRRQRNGVSGAEKNAFLWVPFTRLLDAAQVLPEIRGRFYALGLQLPNKGPAHASQDTKAAPKPSKAASTRPRLALHPRFVATLRAAELAGVTAFLSNLPPSDSISMRSLSVKVAGRRPRLSPFSRVAASPEHMVYWVKHLRLLGLLDNTGPLTEDYCAGEAVDGCTHSALHADEVASGYEAGQILVKDAVRAPTTDQPDASDLSKSAELPCEAAACTLVQPDSWPSPSSTQWRQQECTKREGGEGGGTHAEGSRAFLESFREPQRTVVASAFHDAVRQGAGCAEDVVVAMLQRVAQALHDNVRLSAAVPPSAALVVKDAWSELTKALENPPMQTAALAYAAYVVQWEGLSVKERRRRKRLRRRMGGQTCAVAEDFHMNAIEADHHSELTS